MGVLSCSRRGCYNIMCDRYSSTYKHICNECFDELVALGPDADISAFMKSYQEEQPSEPSAYERFDEEFPLRDPWRGDPD